MDETDLEDDSNKNILARLPYFVYNGHQSEVTVEHEHPDHLLAMAGLYDAWTDPTTGAKTYTFTVLTAGSRPPFSAIHTRVPVLLETDGDVERWMDPRTTTSQALSMLHPPSDTALHWYPVSTLVNNVRNDTPECLHRLEEGVREHEIKEAEDKRMPSLYVSVSWLRCSLL